MLLDGVGLDDDEPRGDFSPPDSSDTCNSPFLPSPMVATNTPSDPSLSLPTVATDSPSNLPLPSPTVDANTPSDLSPTVATHSTCDFSLPPTVATNTPSDLPPSPPAATNSISDPHSSSCPHPCTLSPPMVLQTPYLPDWSQQTHQVTIVPFSSEVGPTFDVSQSPLEVFLHFWPDHFLQQICTQTNLYAKQVMGPAKYADWVELSVPELKAYLGFSILMGIVRLPALDDYWKVDPFLHFPPITGRISRQRFRDISRYLHFVDNTLLATCGQPGYDKLGKVRPVIDHCSKVFLDSYKPHCECAVDEAMIRCECRTSLKQYMPLKPVKRGIKVWVRADSHNGYFSQFEVYQGRGSNTTPELGLGGSVVKTLTRPLVGKFHHVFMDNFFTSPALFTDLLQDGIYACGTVRSNRRGFPQDLKGKRMLKNRYAHINSLTQMLTQFKNT